MCTNECLNNSRKYLTRIWSMLNPPGRCQGPQGLSAQCPDSMLKPQGRCQGPQGLNAQLTMGSGHWSLGFEHWVLPSPDTSQGHWAWSLSATDFCVSYGIVSIYIKYKNWISNVNLFPNEIFKNNYDYIIRGLIIPDFLANWGKISDNADAWIVSFITNCIQPFQI